MAAFLRIVCAVFIMSQATQVLAVSAEGVAAGDRVDEVGFVTTAAADRAASEVQIRRIKNLVLTSSIEDADKAFDELERLQKDLSGRR